MYEFFIFLVIYMIVYLVAHQKADYDFEQLIGMEQERACYILRQKGYKATVVDAGQQIKINYDNDVYLEIVNGKVVDVYEY